MSDNTTEVLVAVLVAACLLLLYCQSSKKQEYMRNGKKLPGLRFSEGFYADMQKHGRFYSEGMQDVSQATTGLNGLETRVTPASSSVKSPDSLVTNMLWSSDAEVQHDIYSNSAKLENSFSSGEKDSALLYGQIMQRNLNRNTNPAIDSHSLNVFHLTDYGQPMPLSRPLTN